MIRCLYTSIERRWTPEELMEKIAPLPDDMRQRILAKRQWRDRQLSAAGKLLLRRALQELFNQGVPWQEITYNAYKRPCLRHKGDFNISHSGNVVICAATDKGSFGIDIEVIRRIDPEDYLDFFSAGEWKAIRGSEHPEQEFFRFWTRKEAVIKAIGRGVYSKLSALDVSPDRVSDGDAVYHLQALSIASDLPCHVAVTAAADRIEPLLVKV